MRHARWSGLSVKLGVAVVVAACTLVQAQQGGGNAGQAKPAPDGGPYTGSGPGGGARVEPGQNLMPNPYRMVEGWPTLNPGMKWGAAINFLPDNKGGTWTLLRTEPPINYFDASGKIVQEHRSGRVRPGARHVPRPRRQHLGGRQRTVRGQPGDGRPRFPGVQVQSGGQAAPVARQGRGLEGRSRYLRRADRVRGAAGRRHPHCRRSLAAADDRAAGRRPAGARTRATASSFAITASSGGVPASSWARMPWPSIRRAGMFVADRSNNRIQIFDKDLNYLDSWKHFGRPSGITILKDDTLLVADSESGIPLAGPAAVVRRRRRRSSATSAGSRVCGSAARKTDRCASSSRAPIPKVWPATSRATSSPG